MNLPDRLLQLLRWYKVPMTTTDLVYLTFGDGATQNQQIQVYDRLTRFRELGLVVKWSTRRTKRIGNGTVSTWLASEFIPGKGQKPCKENAISSR